MKNLSIWEMLTTILAVVILGLFTMNLMDNANGAANVTGILLMSLFMLWFVINSQLGISYERGEQQRIRDFERAYRKSLFEVTKKPFKIERLPNVMMQCKAPNNSRFCLKCEHNKPHEQTDNCADFDCEPVIKITIEGPVYRPIDEIGLP